MSKEFAANNYASEYLTTLLETTPLTDIEQSIIWCAVRSGYITGYNNGALHDSNDSQDDHSRL